MEHCAVHSLQDQISQIHSGLKSAGHSSPENPNGIARLVPVPARELRPNSVHWLPLYHQLIDH
ncbi:hypothetical protein BDW68DRAFT_165960 [Aspergillus falconensis]